MNQQMWTCQSCGGMRFAPGVAFQYSGQICSCSQNFPPPSQPMDMRNTDWQIIQALGRIEKTLVDMTDLLRNKKDQ